MKAVGMVQKCCLTAAPGAPGTLRGTPGRVPSGEASRDRGGVGGRRAPAGAGPRACHVTLSRLLLSLERGWFMTSKYGRGHYWERPVALVASGKGRGQPAVGGAGNAAGGEGRGRARAPPVWRGGRGLSDAVPVPVPVAVAVQLRPPRPSGPAPALPAQVPRPGPAASTGPAPPRGAREGGGAAAGEPPGRASDIPEVPPRLRGAGGAAPCRAPGVARGGAWWLCGSGGGAVLAGLNIYSVFFFVLCGRSLLMSTSMSVDCI